MKIEMTGRFGYPVHEKIGTFTKTKVVFLSRDDIEKLVLEYINSNDDDDREYFILLLHSAAISIVWRMLRLKAITDPIQYSLEDLKQELFIVLIESLDKYNPYEVDYDFYGFFIHRAKNHFRESKIKPRVYNVDIDIIGCEIASKKMLSLEIEDYLKMNLTDRQYKVCTLKSGMYGKFTNEEISCMLGVVTKTIERDWKFCKEHLKNDLFLKEFLKGGF